MNNYTYKNYNDLIDDIINGKYIINQPIIIDNDKISFLENLLNYSNIDSSNLHEALEMIINKLKQKLYNEQLKPNVYSLINHIKDEWDTQDNLFCDHNISNFSGVNKHFQNLDNYKQLVNNLENKFNEQKNYSKILPESELGEYSVLELSNSFDDIQNKCNSVISIIDEDLDILQDEKSKINTIDISLLLDISLKHINLYKEMSNDSTNIDENINNIFMNYTLVLNLLKKQINYLMKIMLEIKKEILGNCELLNSYIENIDTSKIKKLGGSNRDLSFF